MGYAHIENLYRPEAQSILLFKQCYALEKIHGTSAHISWVNGELHFFSGGEKHDRFVELFDQPALVQKLTEHGTKDVWIYGEAYGGKQQGVSAVYGPKLRFVAFDVRVGDTWLSVPQAEGLVVSLGLEFVHYVAMPTEISALNEERDKPSVQSQRNAAADGAAYDSSKREGIVLRPPIEVTMNNGSRICAKHKRAEFCERKTPQAVDTAKRERLDNAEAIADEWVTEMRLSHVLDKLNNPTDFASIPAVIAAMIEDVTREASGEILDDKDTRKAIGARAVQLYKQRIMKVGV